MVIVKSARELRQLKVRPGRVNLKNLAKLRERISKKTKHWPTSEVLIRQMRDQRYGST